MSKPFDPKTIAAELGWLKDHPWFDQKPASIDEFLSSDYLNIEKLVRPGIKEALQEIFGKEVSGRRISHVERAMVTGGIGIGKTTFASIALPYMVHWVLCLKDPQGFYNLLPGTRIAFMQMSTSEDQARDVIFGDIKARIQNSKWFLENAPYDPKFTKQIRFPKDIWIVPGDSAETTFEGYNILAGILDEADSHKVTVSKDFAEQGYTTIESRIASRFITTREDGSEGHKGLLIVIGQMKKATGFANKIYEEMKRDPNAFVLRMSIWESFGWDKFSDRNGRKSFFYDTRRKQIVPKEIVELITNENLIEVPVAYQNNFRLNPVKALRDLAGIPPAAEDPFISLVDRVDNARDRWIERYGNESPVGQSIMRPQFASWFKVENDPRRRAVHVDLAYSANGDALGMAMGHIREMVELDGERKPYIVFDMLLRMKAAPGTEIMLAEVRRIIYELKEDRGFRIEKVSYDGFESTDTIQQLQKRRYEAEKISVDRTTLPYEDLRDALYENRIEFPPYKCILGYENSDVVEIAVQELIALQDTGKKIDHPPDGSKDVADAMAGVCYTLLGNRNFRKGVRTLGDRRQLRTGTEDLAALFSAPPGEQTMPAPPLAGGDVIQLPARLRPQRRP
jgi:hypothetical protein